jgi:deazaflavin-dependent oxidoreductase (nitroreductase family)
MPLSGRYEPSKSDWARNQIERYEATAGTEAGDMNGRRLVILTSVGARSGNLRKAPLIRIEQDGRYAVIASKGGAPTHPRWYFNLKANPHVELQDGKVKADYLAREATGDEKAAWWARAVAILKDFDAYQKKTTRQIPLFVLEPMAEAA